MFSVKQKGEFAAYGSALLWSLFPIFTVLSVSALPPIFAAAISTGLSAIFFALVLTIRREWKQLLERSAWKNMLLATFFIGILFYVLVFIGYRYTSPGNGAVISLMEVFFTFLIVNLLWKHERFIPTHAVGALFMLIGALIVLLPKQSEPWNVGDIIIFFATIFPPVGNIFAQRARKVVNSNTIMFVRSCISALFFLVLAICIEHLPSISAFKESWFLIGINGLFVLGLSRILWIEAIHRIPISKTISLTQISVVFTLIISYVFLNLPITHEQLIGIVPIITGTFLLMRK